MNKVTFVLSRNKNWWAIGGKIIEFFEGVKHSHAAILIDNVVYESVWPKARKIKYEDWTKHYYPNYMCSFSCDDNDFYLIKSDCEEQIGKQYSVFQIVLIGAGMVFPFLNKIFERTSWNGHKYLICTELCGDIASNYFEIQFDEKLDNLSIKELKNALDAESLKRGF